MPPVGGLPTPPLPYEIAVKWTSTEFLIASHTKYIPKPPNAMGAVYTREDGWWGPHEWS